VIVHSSDVIGRAADVLMAWLPHMLQDSRYKRIENLEARVNEVIEDLHVLELELWHAEGGKRRGH
jgi:hypothetical protein